MFEFMLEGWTPLILLAALFVVGVYFLSYKVSGKALLTISLVLTLICFGVVIFSIFFVGGWEGMGLGIVAILVLLGTWLGVIIGILSKKIRTK